jgi:meiotically up-regulated gene 157 (Mug157) protein
MAILPHYPSRRIVLQAGIGATIGLLGKPLHAALAFAQQHAEAVWRPESGERPAPSQRCFQSEAVEAFLKQTAARISDPELRRLFLNCFPNTLDTMVFPGEFEGKPDTAVISGDMPAMWLRDSSEQVRPYLVLAKNDLPLRRLLEGVIRRQTRCLLIDPYANAFMVDLSAPPLPWALHDNTKMLPGVGERKFALDSLCFPIRLAHSYWKATGDVSPFDERWRAAMKAVIATMREQQRKDGPGPYRFEHDGPNPENTLVGGVGNPCRPVGLIASCFRPSDDACFYPFFIPANLFAVTSLRQLATMSTAIMKDTALAADATALADEVGRAALRYGTVATASGIIWAFEVDGFGGQAIMDDANVPSLLALPYLDSSPDAALYARTRSFCWSSSNPWFTRGKAGEGIGSIHSDVGRIWPMSLTMFGLTSTSDEEIARVLDLLKRSSAGTGFIHESYAVSDASKYNRLWFGWGNSLFGEFVAKVAHDRPALLRPSS